MKPRYFTPPTHLNSDWSHLLVLISPMWLVAAILESAVVKRGQSLDEADLVPILHLLTVNFPSCELGVGSLPHGAEV